MEVKELKGALSEELKPISEEIKGAKTAADSAKTAADNAVIESKKAIDKSTEVEGQINIIVKKLDDKEAKDAKNQEALDKLLMDSKHEKVNTGKQKKHFNELLAESIADQADNLAKLDRKELSSMTFQLKAVGDMTLVSPDIFPTADVSISTLRPGIIEIPRRRLHVRQLLQGGSMDGNQYVYVKEVAGDGDLAPTAEAAQKPQLDLRLQEVISPTVTIAGYLKISRQMLADVKGLTTFLQSRLLEKLLRVEDNQLLNGTGVNPQLSGITDAGNHTAYNGSKTIPIERLIDAITQLEEEDRDANGVLVRPRDYQDILLNRAAGGAGTYDLPRELVTYSNGQLYVAGVPVFKSTAANLGEFIVGDWVQGATLITREAPIVRFFEQDVDNVQKNMITVRIEERIAFPIYGDDYFVVGDFEPTT